MQRDRRAAGAVVIGIGALEGLAHPRASGLDHLEIDAQFTAVIDAQAALGGKGVEHRGDVVFGVARGKQHRRYRQHVPHALGLQALEPVAQDRPGKFEVAVLDRHRGQPRPHLLGQLGKFGDRQPVAAAVAADHHADGAGGSAGLE